jgi:hypothetical protein
MVYEWDEKRARRTRLGRKAFAVLLFLVVGGLSMAAVNWLA